MYCRNCGKQIDDKAVVCPACGVGPKAERKFCPNCGEATQANQIMCVHCGTSLSVAKPKDRTIAGLLAIFLGSLGIHKFYLGYSKEALIMLLLSIIGGAITFGLIAGVVEIIALIEGIIYLTKSDEEFEQVYVLNHKGWF